MENDSMESNSTIFDMNTLFASTFGLTVAVGLPLNSISLWVFCIRMKLQTAPVIYLTNLAISDLLFILSLPFRVHYFITTRWLFGNLICTLSETIFSVNFYTSTLFITLISLDRYLAIVHPLQSNFLRSPKVASIASAVVWFIIILMSFPIAFQYQQKDHMNSTVCYEGYSAETWKSAFNLILLITMLGFAVPFVIIVTCFFAVVRVMFRIRKENQTFKRYKICMDCTK
ncbi:lysophosphatidic acid receptor 6-like [Mobula birostris]|uniref:lysophosphatidic acid receptor 6-like n=1 Tax=Mobula birostris TaxID=1983395 RepID=UPI003B28B70B